MKRMRKSKKRLTAGLLAVTMCVTLVGTGMTAEAAAKPKLSTKSVTLKVGKNKTIRVKKAGKAKISWKSSNKKVAAVKKSGKLAAKVTAKAKGNAVITCTVKTGKKKKSLTCKVKVTSSGSDSGKTSAPSPTAPVATTQPTNTPPAVTNQPTTQPTTEPTNQPTNTPTTAPTQKPTPTPVPVINDSIVKSYEGIFDYMGTCINYNGWQQGQQLQDAETVKFVKEQFNSITLENEMKPDAVLGGKPMLISKEEAEALGYVIPESYKEEMVPKLNLDKLDRVLEVAKENGLKMRAHVLQWHQQTPSWYFTVDYTAPEQGDDYTGIEKTTPEVVDARLEFYVRTVMTHILNKEKELCGEAGDLIYAWDVTNEYIHRSNVPTSYSWVSVYGDMGLEPTYVKKAFQEAYGVLKNFGVQDKVVLFYNDYDTYFCADDIVSLVNFINEGEEAKICGGIGMQSHVDIKRPLLEEYGAALDKFLATGLEVQITELDVTINFDTEGANPSYSYRNEKETDADQAAFVKELMELIVGKQKNRDQTVNPKGITGITLWGLYDTISWRSKCSPLLFKRSIKDPKASFYEFVNVGKVNQ